MANEYSSPSQNKYFDFEGGKAHVYALRIMGELDAEVVALNLQVKEAKKLLLEYRRSDLANGGDCPDRNDPTCDCRCCRTRKFLGAKDGE